MTQFKTSARTLTLTFALALLTPVLAQTAPVQTAPAMQTMQMKTAAPAPVTLRRDAKLGTLLTGPTGLTLYTFAKDMPGALIRANFGKILGERGLFAIERLMGMILTTMAVQMFLTGFEQFLHA